MKLSGPTGIQFLYREAKLQSDGEPITLPTFPVRDSQYFTKEPTILQIADDAIEIVDVGADRTLPILVPYSETSTFSDMVSCLVN